MEKNEIIFGMRAVIEAIEAGRDIDKVLIKNDLQGDLARELMTAIRTAGIVAQRVPIERIDRVTRKNHQGVLAFISSVTYQHIGDIIPQLYEAGRMPLIVLLDGITDVRNFGAIARTCECAGVDAIVIPERGSVTVNGDAIKTSAGALHYLPVCRERSINDAIKFLKNSGLTIIAASEKGAKEYTQVSYTGPTAIVMGSEDEGLLTENLRICDEIVTIPQFGNIGSLNVSVAAGVLVYESIRQRNT